MQIVHVSLLLPCPRVNSLYFLLPLSDFHPDIVPVLFGFDFQGCSFPAALLVLVCILFEVHSFNKHVEKGFWQHGLGTSYSNSACFDKDDIWRKNNAVSCTVHVDDDPLPPPNPLHPDLNFSKN